MPRPPPSPLLRRLGPLLVLAVVVLLCYANALRYPFVWDDHGQIVFNRFLRDWRYVPQFFTTDLAEGYGAPGWEVRFYRPLWMLSQLVDYQLWGLNAAAFRFTNLVLHLLNGLLLYAILRELGVRAGWALPAAALFLAHPAHPETTTFIAGRVALMSTAGMLAALWLVLRLMRVPSRREVVPGWACLDIPSHGGVAPAPAGDGVGRSQAQTFNTSSATHPASLALGTPPWEGNRSAHWLTWLAVAGCFAFALLSKETAVTLPVVILAAAVILAPARRLARRDAVGLGLALALVLAGYFIARQTALTSSAYPSSFTLGGRLSLASRALAAYLQLAFVPVHLYPEKNLLLAGWRGPALTGAGLGCLVALLAVTAWAWRRDRRIVFGIALFGIAFSLTSNIIPVEPTFADRWLYWPLVGLLVALASAADHFQNQRPAVARLAPWCWVAVLGFGTLTVLQNRLWRDDITLFETTIRRGGDSARIHTALAMCYLEANQPAAAEPHLLAALEKAPLDETATWAMGAWLESQGRVAESTNWFARAVRLRPRDPHAAVSLARALERSGAVAAAAEELRTAVDRGAGPIAVVALANLLVRREQVDAATVLLRELLARDPGNAEAHNSLGVIYSQAGNLFDAEMQFRLAVEADPGLAMGYANLAAVADQRGDVPTALGLYDRALGLAPRDASLYEGLARLLERHGLTNDAARVRARTP